MEQHLIHHAAAFTLPKQPGAGYHRIQTRHAQQRDDYVADVPTISRIEEEGRLD
jgi:hypothetical protein